MKKLQCVAVVSNVFDCVRRSVAVVMVFIFCLAQLSGCGLVDKHFASYDGPPRIDVDESKIKDAVPKEEPLHPYGTKDYTIDGHQYHPLKSSKGYSKRGYASWYGSKFHNGPTSTQERYNMYAMTAASPVLPLPSYVQVTNLRNGRQVVVRINDRGPFYGNRILDLSYVAAKKLGFVEEGVAPVKVVAIDPKTWGKPKASDTKLHYAKSKEKSLSKSDATTMGKSKIFLQVGAFVKLANAKRLSDKVNQFTNKPVHIEHKEDLYRVQIGPLASSTQGDKLRQLLKQNGFENVTVVTS